MKKQLLLMAAGIAAAGLLSGCNSAYSVREGFGANVPGLFYNDQTRGGVIIPKMQSMKDVEVLGKVYGESRGHNILMLISVGDCGIEAAKKNALHNYPDADDVVNVEVDIKHQNFLPVFNETTTIYRGIAIKYKK